MVGLVGRSTTDQCLSDAKVFIVKRKQVQSSSTGNKDGDGGAVVHRDMSNYQPVRVSQRPSLFEAGTSKTSPICF